MKEIEYWQMFETEDRHWWFLGKRYFVRFLLDSLKLDQKSSILDLGSGTGGMTKYLWGFYKKTIGVENNSDAIKLSRKRGLSVIDASADRVPLKTNSLDLITIFDVLYHKNVNENLVLKEAKRLLKDNAYLLITDCALPFFWSVHDENMMAKKRFKKKELENLVASHGFRVVRSTYLYFTTFPFFTVQRILLKMFKPKRIKTVDKTSFILNFLLLFLIKIDLLLLKANLDLPIGSSIMILAKKE